MTNKEAISNLEELYPVVSEEKKQAIDKAIEAIEALEEENRACFTCKYNDKQFSEMPCKVCDDTFDKWEEKEHD